MTYNRFISGLKAAGVEVDRKILADLAVNDPAAFAALVEVAKANAPATAATRQPEVCEFSRVRASRSLRQSASAASRLVGCCVARNGSRLGGSSPRAGRRFARHCVGLARVVGLIVADDGVDHHRDLLEIASSAAESDPRSHPLGPSPS